MRKATIKYPDELARILNLPEDQIPDELRFLISAELFEMGKLGAGKAAEMAGLGRVEFLYKLAKYEIPTINLDDEQIQVEVDAARKLAK